MAVIVDVVQRDASTLSLSLNVSGVELRGELRAQNLRLKLGEGGGQISAAEMSVEGFEIRSGDLTAQAASFSGGGVRISWGDAGLRIAAESLAGPSLSLALAAGRVEFGAWSVEGLSFGGGSIEVARGSVSEAKVDLSFGNLEGNPSELIDVEPAVVASPHRIKILDWRVLDALRGEFNVDLEVDVTVPVIGHRRAVHRFRVPIEAGAIDFMELEKDLSTLENSILDFAVRPDGTLVLERGIPLLPTRGRGKPILIWRLDPEDQVLAQSDRIRLAVVPRFEMAGSDHTGSDDTGSVDAEPEPKEEGSSSFALRSLVLSNMETHLSLGRNAQTLEAAPSFEAVRPFDAAIRSLAVEQLSLAGQLQHHPGEEQKPGLLTGEVKGLETTLVGLPLALHLLSVAELHVGAVADLQAEFVGLRPTSLDGAIRDFNFEELRWAPKTVA